MLLSLFLRKTVIAACLLLATPALLFGEQSFVTIGAEYCITGPLPADQVQPALALGSSGGILVWQAAQGDGHGWGIQAQALDNAFKKVGNPFRVNQYGAREQELPQVALLKDGGAVFVWQGGMGGRYNIYARFLSKDNVWLTGDVLVNTYTGNHKRHAVVAVLENKNVVVSWGSFNQAGAASMQDVYCRIFTPAGEKVGEEFRVNQVAAYNQRDPAIAPLSGGGFVVSWVSEQQTRGPAVSVDPLASYFPTNRPSVDVYMRIFDPNGSAVIAETLVNKSYNVCATPSVAAGQDGGFMVAWAERDLGVRTNGWDVFVRPFSAAGLGGDVRQVNTYTYGDQFSPRVGSAGSDYLVVWTSLSQDGSWEGVYGQFLRGNGAYSGSEFRANTATVNRQMQPTVASDGGGRFLVVWSGFVGIRNGFDLFGQTYAPPGFSLPTIVQAFAAPANDPFLSAVPSDGSGAPGATPETGATPAGVSGPPAVGFQSVGALASAQGAYNGLIFNTNGLANGQSGMFTLAATAQGTYTGKILVGGRAYSISGRFSPATGSATNSVRIGTNNVTVQIQIDTAGGDQLRGSLSSGQASSVIYADRQVYTKLRATSAAANYTVVIPPDLAGPRGYGFGTVNISPAGVVKFSGTLADGSRVTQGSAISKENFWPLSVALYGGKGSLMSWMQVNSQSDSDVSGDPIVWTKPAGSGGVLAQGFTNEVRAFGSLYSPAAPGHRLMNMAAGSLVLKDGGLTLPLTNAISVDLRNKVTSPQTAKFSLSFTPASGLFRGSTLNPATGRPISFQGVLFEKGRRGFGMFLGSSDSGQVNIYPAQ
jgi:hypothetical protein